MTNMTNITIQATVNSTANQPNMQIYELRKHVEPSHAIGHAAGREDPLSGVSALQVHHGDGCQLLVHPRHPVDDLVLKDGIPYCN